MFLCHIGIISPQLGHPVSDLPTSSTSNEDDIILSSDESLANSDVEDVDLCVSDLAVNEESALNQDSDIPLLDSENSTLISTECDGTNDSSSVNSGEGSININSSIRDFSEAENVNREDGDSYDDYNCGYEDSDVDPSFNEYDTSIDSAVFHNDEIPDGAIPSEIPIISSEKPLYCGSNISTCTSVCAIMQFALSHQLTDEAIEDLLQLLRLMLPSPNNIPTSLYKLKSFLRQFDVDYNHTQVCTNCNKINQDCTCVHATVGHFLHVPIVKPLHAVLISK